MYILGVETSCDETAAAVIQGTDSNTPVRLLSNVVTSSLALHAKTGGIIPEVAAREQIKFCLPVITQALAEAKVSAEDIDAIAVTYGPGLIGSLLIGVETARTLSYVWSKPLIPVNHLYGHIYANWLAGSNTWLMEKESLSTRYELPATPEFPALALVVSGGHTDLVYLKNHTEVKVVGGTRDDAAGEAFDKIGRLLGLPYPAGPVLAKLAEKGSHKAYRFPRPLHNSGDFDFSFSGLKTAVLREVKAIKTFDERTISDIAASVQEAIIDILVRKTLAAAKQYEVHSILLGGGVAANENLQETLRQKAYSEKLEAAFFVPQKSLCTDNAAMIAAAAFYNQAIIPWQSVTANPELYY